MKNVHTIIACLVFAGFDKIHAALLTTGNRVFAECNFFCRVLKVGHSAKSYFTECRTRQRYTLGKEGFAKGQELGKSGHLAKALFAEC